MAQKPILERWRDDKTPIDLDFEKPVHKEGKKSPKFRIVRVPLLKGPPPPGGIPYIPLSEPDEKK